MTAVTLRIAAEFSKVQSDAFLCAAEFSPDDTRAMQEHILYVGYRLGEHLDLPVDYVWTDED
jgi:hypothetical protein